MYSLLLLLIGFGVGGVFRLDRAIRQITTTIAILDSKNKKEEPKAFVTRTDPAFTRSNMAGQADDSAIVIPKSPQLVEFEEQEALRRMNPGVH